MAFKTVINNFVKNVPAILAQQPIRRKAEILPFSANYTKDKASQFYSTLAQTLVDAAIGLHYKYHEVSDNKLQADKDVRVSIGLIRVANINNITSIAMQLFKADSITVPDDTVIHVACYHAKPAFITAQCFGE